MKHHHINNYYDIIILYKNTRYFMLFPNTIDLFFFLFQKDVYQSFSSTWYTVINAIMERMEEKRQIYIIYFLD